MAAVFAHNRLIYVKKVHIFYKNEVESLDSYRKM